MTTAGTLGAAVGAATMLAGGTGAHVTNAGSAPAGASVGLLTLAMTFAVVTGANDGGAILTMGLRIRSLRPLGAIVVFVLGVTLGPLIFGVHVAETFLRKLVSFGDTDGRTAFVIGLCAALAVVAVLTTLGLPTSLTLALIGGITGAGLGYGLPVSASAVLAVLAFGLAAPMIGGLVGLLLARGLRWTPTDRAVPTVVQWATTGGYALQGLAYGANDGQKMLAVFAIAQGGSLSVHTTPGTMTAIACCVVVGNVISLRRLAGRLGRDLLVVRPVHAISAELASSAAVLASASVGMPVSMTQSIAGALVGAGMSDSSRRVRWRAVMRLANAWAMTLPATIALAAAAAGIARWVR